MRYAGGDQSADNELFRAGSLATTELATLRADHATWLSTEGREGSDGRERMRELGLTRGSELPLAELQRFHSLVGSDFVVSGSFAQIGDEALLVVDRHLWGQLIRSTRTAS